jgi:hypothetical protein
MVLDIKLLSEGCWNYSCVTIGHPTRPSYSVCLLGVSTRGVALLVSNKALEQ